MKTSKLLFLGTISLLASVGTVAAGPCTTRIDEVSKLLASRDAGSGPTATGSAQMGQGGSVTSTGTIPSQDSPSGSPAASATPREVPKAGETAKTEATPAMNAVTQGRATSPSDVRAQTQGQPTSAQVAQGQAFSDPDRMKQAMAALDRARTFDREGKEADCMSALQDAGQLSGTK
jgi:hypothetical protein